MENWYTPYQTEQLPQAQRVLVLAPHPDDEIFGCGGSLALYAQQGAQIDVLIASDGAGYALGDERQHIQNTRQNESIKALESLGITSIRFLAMPDRSLSGQGGLVNELVSSMQSMNPQVIMTPSTHEIHPDHLGLARATLAAVNLLPRGMRKPLIMQYEIGGPLKPNMLIDITSVWSLKCNAMLKFESQMMNQNYARHIEALNIYRTYTLPGHIKYVEAYRCITADEAATDQLDDEQGTSSNWTLQVLAAADSQAEALQKQVVTLQHIQQNTCDQLAAKVSEFSDNALEFIRLKVQEKEIRDQIDLLRDDLSRQKHEYAELSQKNKLLTNELSSLLNSHSWRWTKPLRWLMRKIKK